MLDLMEADVTQGPWTGQGVGPQQGTGNMYNMTTGQKVTGPMDMSKAEKLDLADVFGGDEYSTIRKLGYTWFEKPGYFSDIKEKTSIPRGEVARVERAIGRKLENVYMGDLIVPFKDGNYYPQADADFERYPEETVIVTVSKWDAEDSDEVRDGDIFLANRTGASKYYRMWMRVI